MNIKELSEPVIDRHPLITLGLLTAGTQLGSTVIQKMAKRPMILFVMGITVGIYSFKNRKQILAEAEHLTEQGKRLLSKEAKVDNSSTK